MEDAFVMRVLERFTNPRHDFESLAGAKASGSHCLAQIHPIDKSHQQVEKAVGLSEIVDRHDIPEAAIEKGYMV
jgi:hypothetical protein